MVDARGENFVLWFPRTQENTFLDAFQRICFCATNVLSQPGPPVAWTLLKDLTDYLKNTMSKYSDKKVPVSCFPHREDSAD